MKGSSYLLNKFQFCVIPTLFYAPHVQGKIHSNLLADTLVSLVSFHEILEPEKNKTDLFLPPDVL